VFREFNTVGIAACGTRISSLANVKGKFLQKLQKKLPHTVTLRPDKNILRKYWRTDKQKLIFFYCICMEIARLFSNTSMKFFWSVSNLSDFMWVFDFSQRRSCFEENNIECFRVRWEFVLKTHHPPSVENAAVPLKADDIHCWNENQPERARMLLSFFVKSKQTFHQVLLCC